MIYEDKKLFDIFDGSQRYAIQQKKMEWINAMRIINEGDKKDNILEIGACNGGTTYCLSFFCNKLVTLDMSTPAPFTFSEIEKNCNYTYHGGDSHSQKIFNLVKDIKYDVLFIDGDHTYEGSKQDFDMYSPLVKTGGIIIFHDIIDSQYHRSSNCNVARCWDEVKEKFDSNKIFEFCYDRTHDEQYKREFIVESGEHCKQWGGIGVIRL